MPQEGITAVDIYNTHQKRLLLQWIAGAQGGNRLIQTEQNQHPLIGHLNAIHPNQIQVLGAWEMDYLNSLGKNTHHDVIKQLFENEPAVVIITDDITPDPLLIETANKSNTALFLSPIPGQKIIDRIRYYLDNHLAESLVLHGVFMEVYGLGVLLRGESGIGKSELALELINRGHRLIADDAPEFSRTAPDTIKGLCPEALQDFLEVRGLGVLNIREMFGDSAIKPSKNLRLIVKLSYIDPYQEYNLDRLIGTKQNYSLLDVDISEVMVPVAPGRNLAVLVEAATRQHIQLLSGYNAAEDFMRKQKRIMEKTH